MKWKNVFFFTISSQLENIQGKNGNRLNDQLYCYIDQWSIGHPKVIHIPCYSNITGARGYAGFQKGIGQVRNTSMSSAGTSRGRGGFTGNVPAREDHKPLYTDMMRATGLHFHAPDINSTIIARLIPEGARLVENTHVLRNREPYTLHNDFVVLHTVMYDLFCHSAQFVK